MKRTWNRTLQLLHPYQEWSHGIGMLWLCMLLLKDYGMDFADTKQGIH